MIPLYLISVILTSSCGTIKRMERIKRGDLVGVASIVFL